MSERPVLVALLDGAPIATIVAIGAGRHVLRYESTWRAAPTSHPLSLSMPLTVAEHRERTLLPFLWGLLPDSESTLRHYARLYGVSERNPIALLTHLGADCAGAVQFVPPDAVDEYRSAPTELTAEWIEPADVAAELRSVMLTGLPGTGRSTAGRFSLAGAQPKIALLRHDGRWGRPTGRTPTTHILKPPAATFPGFADNEHLCLQIARRIGIEAANSTVERFEDQVAIVVERYDRLADGHIYRRLHQEDVCQALGTHPAQKYESEGGPGLLDVFRLIDQASNDATDDRGRFLEASILNWVLAATDAHAKNFSFLHARGGGIRLAPLYDIASFLPYADGPLYDLKLAMRVHREYLIKRITVFDWIRLAGKAGFREDETVERLRSVIGRVADASADATRAALAQGLQAEFVNPLGSRIIERSQECAAWIEMGLRAKA